MLVVRAAPALRSALLMLTLVASLAGCTDSEPQTAPPKATMPVSLADTVEKVRSGVVLIETTGCAESGTGTGFLVGRRHVVTVEHVVSDHALIVVKQRGKVVARGTVIGQDAARDLAVVRLDRAVNGHRFTFARTAPRLGDEVAALGFPLSYPLTLTKGTVSGVGRTVEIEDVERRGMIQTDTALNPGNSGGPLLSSSGEVVGLVDAGDTSAEGISFAVSAKIAAPLVRAWRAAPQPQKPTCSNTPAPPPPAGDPGDAYLGRFTSVDRLQHCRITNQWVACGSKPSRRQVRLDVGAGARETARAPAPDRGGPAMPMGTSFTTPAETIRCASSSRGLTCTDLASGAGFTIGDYQVLFEGGPSSGSGAGRVPARYEGYFTSVDRLQRCLAQDDSVACTSGPSGQGVALTAGEGSFYGGVVGSTDTGGPAMPIGTAFQTPTGRLQCDSSSRGITCTDAGTESGFTIGDHYVIVRNGGSQQRHNG